jgi:hypothetical protein
MRLISLVVDSVSARWCSLMHRDQPMWPVNGRYECRTCQRKFEVPWESSEMVIGLTARAMAKHQDFREVGR